MRANVIGIMNKPHVEALTYRFDSENPNDRFDEANPQLGHLGNFEYELVENELRVMPLLHFGSVDQARESFEPYLRSWESTAFLSPSRFRVGFRFLDANVIDLEPTPSNTTIHVRAAELVLTGERLTIVRGMKEYPAPEISFQSTPLTDELIYRLKQYRDRQELLPGVAYYILERLEQGLVGNQKNIRSRLARLMKVDKRVLDELSRLSNYPDPRIGRHASRNPVSLSAAESSWIDAVVFRLVRRAGELHNEDNQISRISMNDFPPLL
jgi:hypothetical protein